MEPKDPYKYFRIEARELLTRLDQGLLELEKSSIDLGLRQTLMRFAHTLKGAARVVKHQAIANLAHSFEDDFNPYREAIDIVPPPILQRLSGHVRAMVELVDTLTAPPTLSVTKAAPSGLSTTSIVDERFETVRVEVTELDSLMQTVLDVGVRMGAIRQNASDLNHAVRLVDATLAHLAPRHMSASSIELIGRVTRSQALLDELRLLLDTNRRALEDALSQSEVRLEELRDRTNTLRLLPVSAVFSMLERAAVDVAQQLGKSIEFRTSGGEHRLDGHVLSHLRDALLHVVRNAVDHGIENSDERISLGKSAQGLVEITVQRRGDRLIFGCRDDGRGINVAALRQTLARRGQIVGETDSALDDAAVLQLLLEGGFSSRDEVTQISGRGVGMEIVSETAGRLKGRVACTYEPNKGTEISLSVPLSLSSMTVLLVEANGQIACLPMEYVQRTLWRSEVDIASSPEGDRITYENRSIPFVALSKLLDPEVVIERRQYWSIVVLATNTDVVCIGVDRLVTSTEIIVRPLPAVIGPLPMIWGTTLDFKGNPQPVLDPDGVAAAARAGFGRRSREAFVPRKSILVIDDSLTTRMLEQNILESAGYRVDLAVSGEDGLEKARLTRYDLFVVDVEMPGMNGFEFIRLTREDTTLRDTPAILVTSVATLEAKRLGREVGASAYIVKGEFEQGVFMEAIRNLVGQVTLSA